MDVLTHCAPRLANASEANGTGPGQVFDLTVPADTITTEAGDLRMLVQCDRHVP